MTEFLQLVHEMSPYLLLGFLFAGLMHAFIPGRIYSQYLSARNFRSVVWAALFGIPLPLCSCGVLPTAMSLRREGASKGATVSFLIATPQTGVDSIIATFSLLGLPFAVIRPIVALVTALLGGSLINRFDCDENAVPHDTAAPHSDHCGCGDHCDSEEHCHCGCDATQHDTTQLSFGKKLALALHYGFVDTMQDIGKWLIVGLIVAGLITVFTPDGFLAQFSENAFLSYGLVLLIAIPMYLCATGSIPIAAALMLKGLSPGAALVLLMAGPACNMASILVIQKVLGRRTLLLYLAAIVGGAIIFALGIDNLLPREWFVPTFASPHADCCAPETPLYQWIATGTLLLFLINAFVVQPLLHKKKPTAIKNDELLFNVSGMTCNHCRNHVEKALLNVPGVTAAEVSLEQGEARVRGNATPEALCAAVAALGYDIVRK